MRSFLLALALQRERGFRRPASDSLGVPPAAERITNDPRFSIIPSTKDRG